MKLAQERMFFFERKNQKTFAPLRAVLKTPMPSGQKFFAERRPREGLFFKKATAFFSMANA